eukprot:11156815-Lingulodinium_polyedra.AAC.1
MRRVVGHAEDWNPCAQRRERQPEIFAIERDPGVLDSGVDRADVVDPLGLAEALGSLDANLRDST